MSYWNTIFGPSTSQQRDRLLLEQDQLKMRSLLGSENAKSLLGVGSGTYTDPQTMQMRQRGPEMGASQALIDNTQLPQPGQGGQAPQLVEPLLGSKVPQNQQRVSQLTNMAFPEAAQEQILMQQRMAGMPDLTPGQRAAIKLNPKEGTKAFAESQFLKPIDEQRLIEIRDNLARANPNDPNIAKYDDIIAQKRGLLTDPNKINESEALVGERRAQQGSAQATAALSRAKLDMMNDTKLDEDTLERGYQSIVAGQKFTDVFPNMGRGTQGPGQMTAIQNFITRRMKEDGKTPAQIAAAKINLAAQGSAQRKVAERTGVIDMASAELDAFVDQGMESLGKMDQSKFVPWNRLVNLTESELADNPTLAEYKTILSGVRGAYASVLQRGGATTVEALNSADKLLNSATGPAAAKAIFAQMKREAAAVHGAGNKVQNDIQGRITGGAEKGQPVAPSIPNAQAISYLQANPHLRAQFDAKYGAGASAKVLGQ